MVEEARALEDQAEKELDLIKWNNRSAATNMFEFHNNSYDDSSAKGLAKIDLHSLLSKRRRHL